LPGGGWSHTFQVSRGVSERCAEEAQRHLAHWPHAVESQRAGCGGPGVGADGFGAGLDSSRFTAADGCAGSAGTHSCTGSAGTHSCTAVERGCGGSAETVQLAGVCVVSECGGYSSTPVVGASRLADAARERHGWRSSLTSVQANRQNGLASDGEERRRIRVHAGMDCKLESIERNSSTLSVRSTEKRTLLLGASCMHVIKRLQCTSNGPRRASPDFLRSPRTLILPPNIYSKRVPMTPEHTLTHCNLETQTGPSDVSKEFI
jgi:hypothetical protein